MDLRTEFPPLNECMYCSSTENLTREHIVPYGLGGPGVIPKSSCESCATITGRFEREVLRGPLWGLRAYLRLSSRRRNKMPTKLPLTLIRKGQEEKVMIPIDEHPIMLCFPIFSIPSCLTGKHVEGIHIRGVNTYCFGKSVDQVLQDHDADNMLVTDKSKPVAFARMIAKIGWACAVAEGFQNRLNPELVDAILHNPNHIGRWVGTYTDPLDCDKDKIHGIQFHEDRDQGLFLAQVKLFAYTNTPKYGVVLGKLA